MGHLSCTVVKVNRNNSFPKTHVLKKPILIILINNRDPIIITTKYNRYYQINYLLFKNIY